MPFIVIILIVALLLFATAESINYQKTKLAKPICEEDESSDLEEGVGTEPKKQEKKEEEKKARRGHTTLVIPGLSPLEEENPIVEPTEVDWFKKEEKPHTPDTQDEDGFILQRRQSIRLRRRSEEGEEDDSDKDHDEHKIHVPIIPEREQENTVSPSVPSRLSDSILSDLQNNDSNLTVLATSILETFIEKSLEDDELDSLHLSSLFDLQDSERKESEHSLASSIPPIEDIHIDDVLTVVSEEINSSVVESQLHEDSDEEVDQEKIPSVRSIKPIEEVTPQPLDNNPFPIKSLHGSLLESEYVEIRESMVKSSFVEERKSVEELVESIHPAVPSQHSHHNVESLSFDEIGPPSPEYSVISPAQSQKKDAGDLEFSIIEDSPKAQPNLSSSYIVIDKEDELP